MDHYCRWLADSFNVVRLGWQTATPRPLDSHSPAPHATDIAPACRIVVVVTYALYRWMLDQFCVPHGAPHLADHPGHASRHMGYFLPLLYFRPAHGDGNFQEF